MSPVVVTWLEKMPFAMLGHFGFDWSGMNTDSSETKRLADAVASVAATMAEMFNERFVNGG